MFKWGLCFEIIPTVWYAFFFLFFFIKKAYQAPIWSKRHTRWSCDMVMSPYSMPMHTTLSILDVIASGMISQPWHKWEHWNAKSHTHTKCYFCFDSWMVNCTWHQASLYRPTLTTQVTTPTLTNAYHQRAPTCMDYTPMLRSSSWPLRLRACFVQYWSCSLVIQVAVVVLESAGKRRYTLFLLVSVGFKQL